MHLFKNGLINESVRLRVGRSILKRFSSGSRSKDKKKSPADVALAHFDDFYKAVFTSKWPSVRLGLLSREKYVAVVNNFGNVEETENLFRSQGAFDLKSFFETQKTLNFQSKDASPEPTRMGADLSEIISQQLDVEEEKESQIHPEGMDFKRRADYLEDSQEEKEEYSYQPEDARTSLKLDLTKSVIDESRLILPNSVEGAAKLNEFIPATELRGAGSYISESEYYKYYRVKPRESYTIEEELELEFPETLKVYTFDRADISDFPQPTRNSAGIYNFLKIDGSDLLAALALGVQEGDNVLDLCSTSTSIAYCLFLTFRTRFLLCCNTTGEMESLFRNHVINLSSLLGKVLYFTSSSFDESTDVFHKVLVEVPSTNDRVSLFEREDNIFHTTYIKRRLKLPEFQCECLKKGLTLVRPGGTVVYTTSTLSPIQNDAVVGEAIEQLWEEQRLEFIIKDLTPATQHMSTLFNFGNYLNMKFGILVVPFTPMNFGPRYICKIVKKEQKEPTEPTEATKPTEQAMEPSP